MFFKNLFYQCLYLKLASSASVIRTICSVSSLVVALTSNCAKAEIVADDTLGKENSVVTPLTPNFDEINGGAVRGFNLFHSFEQFNIEEGHRAVFKNPNGIENIIGRVTGGSRSEILGTVNVLGNANLFLINPNGIVFGPNSKLALGGSFVATTANAIRFGDQGFFSASVKNAPPLLTVQPSALLFNQIANQPITIQSTANLQLSGNQSLLLVGGDVNLSGGLLRTQSGRVDLGGLAGAGTVGLNVDSNNLRLSFPNDAAFANVSLTNGATIETDFGRGTTSGLSRGDVQVQGKRIILADGSEISASTFGTEPGGTLTVKASESVELTGESRLLAETEGTGTGGELTIETGQLIVRDGSQVAAGAFNEGSGGKLTINASEVTVSGTSEDGEDFSSILTQTDGAGNAGELTIKTKRLTVQDGARVSTATTSSGEAGRLTITSSAKVKLIGTSKSGDNPQPSGLSASAQGSGKPGDLIIETKQLIIQDGARAFTSNLGTSTDGGTLTVKASELVDLSGTSTNGEVRSGLLVGTEGIGVGGKLTIETPLLQVKNGAFVSARSVGEGQAGSVILNASESVDIIGTSVNGSEPSSITTEAKGAGSAGNLTIETGQLSIKNGAEITSSSTGQRRAGNTEITAESINLDRGNIISQTKSGDGGNIDLSVENLLLLRHNSQISTTAGTDEADGNGGNIKINTPSGFIVAIPKENSDITANAFLGSGGKVEIISQGVFGIEPRQETNDITSDITASSQQGVQGVTNIDAPDNNSIQNSLIELPQNQIDSEALIATSCVVRSKQINGTFYIIGSQGFPYRPGDAVPSKYSAIEVQSVLNDTSASPRRRWKMGDPIIEPSGVYRLANGRRILSRECGK